MGGNIGFGQDAKKIENWPRREARALVLLIQNCFTHFLKFLRPLDDLVENYSSFVQAG